MASSKGPSSTGGRRYARVKTPKGCVVAWQGPSQRRVSRAQTMGLGGLFLSTNDAPEIGSTLQLLFDVAGREVRARAVVRSIVAGQGMGIEIIAMEPEHRGRLSQWLKQLPADSEASDQRESRKQRRFERISLPKGMWAAWYGGGEQQTSRVGTLGMAGVFLCEPNPPVVGTNVRLAFEVPGGNVTAEAIVRSVEPGKGMGVEFTKVGSNDKVLLRRLLQRLLRI